MTLWQVGVWPVSLIFWPHVGHRGALEETLSIRIRPLSTLNSLAVCGITVSPVCEVEKQRARPGGQPGSLGSRRVRNRSVGRTVGSTAYSGNSHRQQVNNGAGLAK